MITLDEMSQLASALIDADVDVANVEQNLKEAKEKARKLREDAIPSAMQELGLEQIVLSTGQKLTIRQEVYASIPKDRKYEAFAWLDEHGFSGLIKTEVVTEFARGDDALARKLAEELTLQGYEVELDQGVHSQTLKAFLKEQISSGAAIPLELFGAIPVWQAKITNK